jgi:hypothetical protein
VSGVAVDGAKLMSAVGTWSGASPISYARQWLRCDAAAANCAVIPGATAASYTLSSSDEGSTVAVQIVATNSIGASTATSAATVVVTSAPPVNSAVPGISGTAVDRQTLSSTTGTWSGAAPITFTRQWRRCDAAGQNCVDIQSATGASHALVDADVGSTIRVVVIAANVDGSVVSTSDATPVVTAIPLANTTPPTITGTAVDGTTLGSTVGSWTGATPISYARQWLRCDALAANCVAIGSAVGSSYKLTAADVGMTVELQVTATDSFTTSTTTSSATSVVAGSPPINSAVPVISGTPLDGQKLTVTNGTWTGATPISYSRQWLRCDSTGGTCASIAATGASYTLTDADVGSTIRASVTATNADGAATTASDATAVVTAIAPAGGTAPAISGIPEEGQLLTLNAGTWTGTPTPALALRWQRCDVLTGICTDVTGAASLTYRLGTADVGTTINAVVTASNVAGAVAATTLQTLQITPGPPVVNKLPTVTGTASEGQVLTGKKATFTGTKPITSVSAWVRCAADGTNCSAIAGASGATQTLTTADIGHALRFRTIASNQVGTTSVDSASTAPVAAVAPANSVPPTIGGPSIQGQTLTATPGTWTGTTPITDAFQWQRCDLSGNQCADIPGAAGTTYVLTSDDVGNTVVVQDTASNGFGQDGVATSDTTPVVQSGAPIATSPPEIDGRDQTGSLLTATRGDWTETVLSYALQWQRCDSGGDNCTDIAGAVGDTYVPTTDDVDSTLVVAVTATTAGASGTATSAPTDVISAASAGPVIDAAFSQDGDLSGLATVTLDPVAISEGCLTEPGICTDPPIGGDAAVFPDGQHIAYVASDDSVHTVGTDGTGDQTVFDPTQFDSLSIAPGRGLSVTPDSQGIFAIAQSDSDTLVNIPADGSSGPELVYTSDVNSNALSGEQTGDLTSPSVASDEVAVLQESLSVPDSTGPTRFSDNYTGAWRSQIMLMGTDGSDAEPLTFPDDAVSDVTDPTITVDDPEISRSGTSIAFWGIREPEPGIAGGPGVYDAVLDGSDAIEVQKIVSDTGFDASADDAHPTIFPTSWSTQGGGVEVYNSNTGLLRSVNPLLGESKHDVDVPAGLADPPVARTITLPTITMTADNSDDADSQDEGGVIFRNADDSADIPLQLADSGRGVASVEIKDNDNALDDIVPADCSADCPTQWNPTIHLSAQDLASASTEMLATVTNADGHTAQMEFSIERDIDAPTPPDDTAPIAVQTSATAPTQLAWQPFNDPLEPDGADGSGVVDYDVRLQNTDGTFGTWTETQYPGLPVAGIAPGATVTFQVRATDGAGHVSQPVPMSAKATPATNNADCATHAAGAYPASCVDDTATPVTDSDIDALEHVSLVRIVQKTDDALTQAGLPDVAEYRIEIGLNGPNPNDASAPIPGSDRWATYRSPPSAWTLGNVHNGWLMVSDAHEQAEGSCCPGHSTALWRRGQIYTGSRPGAIAGNHLIHGPPNGCGWVIALNSPLIDTGPAGTGPEQPGKPCFHYDLNMAIANIASWTNCLSSFGAPDQFGTPRLEPCKGGTKTPTVMGHVELCANVALTDTGQTSPRCINRLGYLKNAHCVEWRYITKDGRWAMVKVRSRPDPEGSWVFIRAAALGPIQLLPNVNTYSNSRCLDRPTVVGSS